jgi:hypothetical protein
MSDFIRHCCEFAWSVACSFCHTIKDIQRDCMAKYGFQGPGAVMAATMQIQMHSMSDPEMMQDVQFMLAKLNGR